MSSGFRPFSLEDSVAIVTGASRGIGHSITLVLAKAGTDLVLVGRNAEALEKVAQEVQDIGAKGLAVPCDVRVKAQVDTMAGRAVAEFGRVDILVNNAGKGSGGDVERISEERWDEVLDTNLRGPFLCAQAVVPLMRGRKYGRIVNIASISGQTGGVAGGADYAGSKGGLIALTKTLARDLGPDGITANAIAPGQMDTGMGRISEEAKRRLEAQTPLGRLGTGDDIAYTVLFLASEEAGYITGATIDVNGGLLKR